MFETNEQGELLLALENATAPKKKATRKKKEEEPKFLPPFFSEDYFKHIISPNGLGGGGLSTTPHLILKWKNEEYLPLYSLGIKLPLGVPYYEYKTLIERYEGNPGILEQIRIGKFLKQNKYDNAFNYFKKLWDTKNYKLLCFFWEKLNTLDNETDFKAKMGKKLNDIFKGMLETPPNTSIQTPQNNYLMGMPRITARFKYENEWRWTQVRQQGASWNEMPMYLTNMGFLGKQVSPYSAQFAGVASGLLPIKPLACIVFKKENYDLLKAYVLANEPIPADLLEFWADQSIEDPNSSISIARSYVKSIRNPYKKLGLNIVVKEDLTAELFSRPELPRFRTHMDKINWIDNILENYTIEEKKKLRIA